MLAHLRQVGNEALLLEMGVVELDVHGGFLVQRLLKVNIEVDQVCLSLVEIIL